MWPLCHVITSKTSLILYTILREAAKNVLTMLWGGGCHSGRATKKRTCFAASLIFHIKEGNSIENFHISFKIGTYDYCIQMNEILNVNSI